MRESLDTRDWARAGRKLAALEAQRESGRERKRIAQAVTAFLDQCSLESSTYKKYCRQLGFFSDFVTATAVGYIGEVGIEHLDAYRSFRKVCALTWSKELQLLRTFFGFCLDRKWTDENPAKRMKMPSDPKPKERIPYTREEIASIIAACDTFGRNAYERLRARAMILLMRAFGLRVSDVATLELGRIRGGEIFIHALKNGQALWLPLSQFPQVKQSLDCVPLPKGAPPDCKFYFWSGVGSREGHIKTVDRTLQAVFRKSGVENAHAHRFRHYATSRTMPP